MMIFSDQALSRRIERTEALVNLDFVQTRARHSPNSKSAWIEVAGTFALFDGINSPCTQTFGLGMEDITNDDLDQIETFFKERKAPIYHEVSPLADANLLKQLLNRGYQPFEYTNVLFQPLQHDDQIKIANSKIQISKVAEKDFSLFAETSAKGWSTEIPELYNVMVELASISVRCKNCFSFMAKIEEKPIATGTLFIIDNFAVIAGDSTIPEGRKQGAQKALLDARLQFAKEKGCEIALMGALPGSQSQINGEKNGFRIAYIRTKWHPA